MPLRRGRVGRPGLLGTVARTAVVAGTATATSNAVNRRGARRAAEQQGYSEQQAPPPPPQQAPPPPAAASAGQDTVAQLGQLAELHSSGALSDAEFAAAKAKLLS
ncbi:SHOCT domain-containing protein [Nocardia salmonicida]|uniref:SHOCT domain-containing protein n=1 Tax=Nocardia salmonicida TaxID=53431 RepID=UPI0007A55C86|nr:SHOCT domain-containing protein [Nocardia salmonicida]